MIAHGFHIMVFRSTVGPLRSVTVEVKCVYGTRKVLSKNNTGEK